MSEPNKMMKYLMSKSKKLEEEAEQEILINCIKNWKKTHNGYRFGQYLVDMLAEKLGRRGKVISADAIEVKLFYIEDEELSKLLK